MKALKQSKIITDAQLGTVTGKILNGRTLRKMLLIKKEDFAEHNTDLKESSVVSNLMDDFPPICKQDPSDVRVNFVYEHWQRTGETIKFDDIPKTMYGSALPVAIKRKSKKKATSEADDDEEASEAKKKKVTKEKGASSVQRVRSDKPTLQDEVQDLKPTKILNKRTRSGKSAGSSQSPPRQPSISKKNRKPSVRKMKVSTFAIEEEEEIETATDLVTSEVKRKGAADEAALQKVLEIAKEIDVPTKVLLKKSLVEAAHKVIELI